MNIRAITFDIGGTLIEPWPSVGEVYAEVAARYGVKDIDPAPLTGHFMQAWKTRVDFDYSHESWFAIIRKTFGDKASRLPPEFYPAVFDRFAEPDTWLVYDDVLPTLNALRKRGFALGAISNWDDRLRPLLARLELAPYFTSIVVSVEVGAPKPCSRLFRRAAAELKVDPGELLHVGDHYALDVLGAEAIGATGRQVVRGRVVSEPWQIRSLLDLDDVYLAELGKNKMNK